MAGCQGASRYPLAPPRPLPVGLRYPAPEQQPSGHPLQAAAGAKSVCVPGRRVPNLFHAADQHLRLLQQAISLLVFVINGCRNPRRIGGQAFIIRRSRPNHQVRPISRPRSCIRIEAKSGAIRIVVACSASSHECGEAQLTRVSRQTDPRPRSQVRREIRLALVSAWLFERPVQRPGEFEALTFSPGS